MYCEKKPKLVVFDLDHTLWPFCTYLEVTPPFRKCCTKVIDADGQNIRYCPDSPRILKKLYEQGFEIAVASKSRESEGAHQLLKLFDWNKYIKYKQIFPGAKTIHFSRIKNESGIKYEDMIFFDDQEVNIRDITKIGVFSVLVRGGGIKQKVVEDGLKRFARER